MVWTAISVPVGTKGAFAQVSDIEIPDYFRAVPSGTGGALDWLVFLF